MFKASTGACPPETKSSFSVQYCSVCFIFSFVVFCRQIFVALRVGDEYFPQTIPSRLSVVFTPQLASYPSCGSQPSSTGPRSGTCVMVMVMGVGAWPLHILARTANDSYLGIKTSYMLGLKTDLHRKHSTTPARETSIWLDGRTAMQNLANSS